MGVVTSLQTAWFSVGWISRINSAFGWKLVCPVCMTLTGSTWPPGAPRRATARRELKDPISPPSTSTGAGAEGGSASCCGIDSSSLAALTGNLTMPELSGGSAPKIFSIAICPKHTMVASVLLYEKFMYPSWG